MANVEDIKNVDGDITVIDSSMNIKINTGKALQDADGNTVIDSDGDIIINAGCYIRDHLGNPIIDNAGNIGKEGTPLLIVINNADISYLSITNNDGGDIGLILHGISVLENISSIVTLKNINQINAEKVDVTDDIRIANGHDLKLYSDNFSALKCSIDGNTGNINTVGNIDADGVVTAGQVMTDELNFANQQSFIYVLELNATALKITSGEPAVTHLTIDTLNLRNISNQDLDIASGKDLTYNNGATIIVNNGVVQALVIEDKFLRNDGNDTTSGKITATGGFQGDHFSSDGSQGMTDNVEIMDYNGDTWRFVIKDGLIISLSIM